MTFELPSDLAAECERLLGMQVPHQLERIAQKENTGRVSKTAQCLHHLPVARKYMFRIEFEEASESLCVSYQNAAIKLTRVSTYKGDDSFAV